MTGTEKREVAAANPSARMSFQGEEAEPESWLRNSGSPFAGIASWLCWLLSRLSYSVGFAEGRKGKIKRADDAVKLSGGGDSNSNANLLFQFSYLILFLYD